MAKPNNSAERGSNIEREKTEQKEYDMGVQESKTQSSLCGKNLVKRPHQDGSDSSNNMLLTKSNDGTAVESNNDRDENKQTDYELENLENTKLDSSCVRALVNGSSPNVATQMNRKGTQLAK
eukprot:5537310-Ditylum_brightwellii.AAC.1